MADVKWIKIVTDIFDDEKIQLIEAMPEADAIIVLWFKLLCLAGKQNNCGVFVMSDKIPYTDEMFATIFRRPVNTVRLALMTFEKYGMIEIINDIVTIPNWEKHQSLDAYERKKQMDRERIAKKRADQKENAKLLQGVADMSQNVADCRTVEEDKEEDKNKNKSLTNVKHNEDAFASFAGEDTALKEALIDFMKMRKSVKKPLTDKAKERLLKKLQKFPHQDWVAIVNQSVDHCWLDFWPLHKDNVADANEGASYDLDKAIKRAGETAPKVRKRHRADQGDAT